MMFINSLKVGKSVRGAVSNTLCCSISAKMRSQMKFRMWPSESKLSND